jgi:CHAT domain-containing protein
VRSLPALAFAALVALSPLSAVSAPPAPVPRGPSALAEAKRLHGEVDDLLKNKGRYGEALKLAERELAIREANLQKDDPLVAEALHDLAEAHVYLGDVKESEPLYRRALAIYEKKRGKDEMDLAWFLDDFATALTNMRRLDEAEGLFSRSLLISRKAPGGSGKKLVAQTINNMAGVQYFRGNYDEAITMFRQGLLATEEALGLDDPLVATTASNLASALDRLGRYADSKPLHGRALAIREKAFGPEHPLVALSLSNLGVVASDGGDYVKAGELHERALAIREKVLGPEHPDVAVSLNNLASAHENRGDQGRAKPLFERALGILEKKFGPEHPKTVQVLHNYTALLVAMGDATAPARLARLAETQKKKDPNTFDIRSMDTSLWISQLALQIGIPREARQLAGLVLEAVGKKLGESSTRGAQCLEVIAESYEREGDSKRADESFQRAIAMAEKTYGPSHDQLARFLSRYASMLAENNVMDRALDLATRSGDIDEHNLRLILGAGSESQKRAYAAASAAHAEELVSMHVIHAPKDPRAIRFGLLAVLRRKGRVLDALVDGVGSLRRALSAEDAALLDELAAFRSIVARTLTKPASSPEEELVVSVAEKKVETLEAQISARSAEFRAVEAPVTIEAVQKGIPEGAALVEVFLLHPRVKHETRPPRYVVYILERKDEPRWVDLGEAEPIDDAVEALHAALRDPERKDAFDLARAVDEKVMRPVRKQLGKARQILFSPDSKLNLVPIGALLDEKGRFLVEDYSISYLVSGRDLMRMGSRSPARSRDFVVANPEFGERSGAKAASGERGAAGLSGAFFSELPGTGQEAAAIGRILPEARVITQAAATEEVFKELHGPRLLHVATHGFFLRGSNAGRTASRGLELDTGALAEKKGREPNPLLFSGLALAQANVRPADGEDGILTALEASALDLWGTKLVVLSACETGLGELENGEGVSGLRRALFTAGAESAIMSLWKVDDEATRDLMIGTYERLSQGGGRAESLREAQLALLGSARYRHPYYWASFVEVGDYTTLAGIEPKLRFDAARVAPGARGCTCETSGTHSDVSWAWGFFGLVLGISRRAAKSAMAPGRRRAARRN